MKKRVPTGMRFFVALKLRLKIFIPLSPAIHHRQMSKKKSTPPPASQFSPQRKKQVLIALWCGGLLPLVVIACLLMFQSEDDLPSLEMLDNPPELLASVVYADDGETELGRYWKINRSSVEYKDISPFVTDALISTEDERFHDHAGVDFHAIGRAAASAGTAGGASTITQQLAKMLFTLQMREQEELARAKGEKTGEAASKVGIFSRLGEKARENIIAARLEKRYTKEEIITMYLNQFDFLHNAVGISNAARVYFNKSARDLSKDEAAMLVGMCNNPNLFNPYSFQTRDYREILAERKKVPAKEITAAEISKARTKDSLRAVNRRNLVLRQWLKNSESGNEALRTKITEQEYEQLKNKQLVTDYQNVDHGHGLATYFRESVRAEVTDLLNTKLSDGSLKYKRKDGKAWDIYSDGLRIYTTVNADMQQYAEEAVERHLKENLQPAFNKNNRGLKNFPFSNSLTNDEVARIMYTSMKRSNRYKAMTAQGFSASEIEASFKKKIPMTIFSWKGERDTVMSPYDSMRYYKSYLQAGLMSIEPQTGFIKAWVGGTDIDHFAFDHVRQGKRQVGSTIKPFVYATAFSMNVVQPCTMIPNIRHCVDLYDGNGNPNGQWCPDGDGNANGEMLSVQQGLQSSNNHVITAVLSKMGSAGPIAIAKTLENMNIKLNPTDIAPAMILGSMDLSLYELIGAQATFVNNGIFNKPTSILRIEDRNGNIIYETKPVIREALNESVAYSVLKMMETVVTGGTGAGLRSGNSWGGIRYPTAGKTGTTQNNSDGWFVGLTPELATGVWVGAEDRGVHFKSTSQGQGARTALPIYGYYMQKVYKDKQIGLSTREFQKPKNFDDNLLNCFGNDPAVAEQNGNPVPLL